MGTFEEMKEKEFVKQHDEAIANVNKETHISVLKMH